MQGIELKDEVNASPHGLFVSRAVYKHFPTHSFNYLFPHRMYLVFISVVIVVCYLCVLVEK